MTRHYQLKEQHKNKKIVLGAFGQGLFSKEIKRVNGAFVRSYKERKSEPFSWREDLPVGQKTWKPVKKKINKKGVK